MTTFAIGKCGDRQCAVMEFIFTHGLLVDFVSTEMTYDYSARYCYPSKDDALAALRDWNGKGDPPGRWAKEKVSGRLGPALLEPDGPQT